MVQSIRVSRNLAQAQLAVRAGVSRGTVSGLERGLVDGMTVGTLRALSRALGMPPIVSLGWRTPEVERLRDRLHAAMVEHVVSTLGVLGWEMAPEHSFNHYGERGWADILAWHAAERAWLVVETKTRLWDLQDTLGALDRKRRLLPGIAARELDWRARAVGVLLVLPELSTHRHVAERHSATFQAALPARQVEVRNWLSSPTRDLRGLWFCRLQMWATLGRGRGAAEPRSDAERSRSSRNRAQSNRIRAILPARAPNPTHPARDLPARAPNPTDPARHRAGSLAECRRDLR